MSWMTLISDLHGRTPLVRPDSYLVLLGGDICPDKNQYEFLDGPFRAWLANLPCPCIAVPGNHDTILETEGFPQDLNWSLVTEPRKISVANTSIFCLPGVLDGGAFKCDEKFINESLKKAEGSDIILSHQPPLGILDSVSHAKHPGSITLRYWCYEHKIKLSVFGHIHEGRGWAKRDETYFVNATLGAGCGRDGKPVLAPYSPWGLADNSWR